MIYILRHGRTFEDGEKSYDLGPSDDPPLTDFGLHQARFVAQFLSYNKIDCPVICGPQQRHRKMAEQITSTYAIDKSLNEGGQLTLRPDTISVTSNGVLKKFYGHVDCGNLCILDNDGTIVKWNISP